MILKKIFNLFYKDIVSQDGLSRFRSLFNVIATQYSVVRENRTEKKYIFLNKTILKRTDINDTRFWTIGNKVIKKESLKILFQKRISKKIDDKYDDIYFCTSNIGEYYTFLKYVLKDCIKKHNSKHPIIIADRKQHKTLANILHPEIPCIVKNININLHKVSVLINNKHYTAVPPKWYFKKTDALIASKKPG